MERIFQERLNHLKVFQQTVVRYFLNLNGFILEDFYEDGEELRKKEKSSFSKGNNK